METTNRKDSTNIEDSSLKTSSNNLKLDILLITSTMQNQNGVRQNDFVRYANYCRRKINK